MTYESWDDQYKQLKRDFATGKIANATTEQLKSYLVVIANVPMAPKDEKDRFTTAINSRLRRWTEMPMFWIAVVSLIINIVLGVIAFLQWKYPNAPAPALIDQSAPSSS